MLSGLRSEGQILSVYDVSIGFNPLILHFLNAQDQGALGGGPLFDVATGSGFVSLFGLSMLSDAELSALQGNSLTLATLSFSGIGLGTSALTLLPVSLGGALVGGTTFDLLTLPHDVASASATIESRAVPEPGTLALLMLALPLLAARVARRRR